jgi:predicted lipoprotein
MTKLLAGLCAMTILFACNPSEMVKEQANNEMAKIEKKVADDAVKQYNIVKAAGSGDMDLCTQASMVAAAMLQAKHSANYKKWKEIEIGHCQAAGVPQ